MNTIRFVVFLVVLVTFSSCWKNKIDDIVIGDTLYFDRDAEGRKELAAIIRRAEKKDRDAVLELVTYTERFDPMFNDVGYIMTQIINRMGESEFIKVSRGLMRPQRHRLAILINAGLMNGDNDFDGDPDSTDITKAYPKLYKAMGVDPNVIEPDYILVNSQSELN